MNKGNVLITGIGGFVACHVAKTLKNRGYNVIGLYRTKRDFDLEMPLVQCDISDYDKLKSLDLPNIDTIVHFAATTEPHRLPMEFVVNNVLATENLIKFAKANKINNFINFSSYCVYGMTTDSVVKESSPKVDLDSYGMSKLIAEELVANENDLNTITVRLPAVVGENAKSHIWLNKTAIAIKEGKEVSYYNKDNLFNSIIHVDDISEFIIYLLNNSEWKHKTVHMSTSTLMKLGDILKYIKQGLGSSSELVCKGTNEGRQSNLDVSLIKEVGFTPLTMEKTLDLFINDLKR